MRTTTHKNTFRPSLVLPILLLTVPVASAQSPSYTGAAYGNAAVAHDSRLRWAVGVQNVQVVRSAPENPTATDGYTGIWRHQQFIAYWGGRFWVMHDGPATRVAWSTNGLNWSPAESSEIFNPSGHHRMGFYVGSNGVFLSFCDRGGGGSLCSGCWWPMVGPP